MHNPEAQKPMVLASVSNATISDFYRLALRAINDFSTEAQVQSSRMYILNRIAK